MGEGFWGQELGSVLNKTSWGWGHGLDVPMDTWKKQELLWLGWGAALMFNSVRMDGIGGALIKEQPNPSPTTPGNPAFRVNK